MNSLQQLKLDIKQCRACEMCNNNPPGTCPVPGVGNINAKVMLIGECPGINEIHGEEPFIGRSGKLLRKTLAEFGFKSEDFYITNVAKCVSRKGNKNVPIPKKLQKFCSDKWLKQEIELVSPNIIMTLGQVPIDALTRIYPDRDLTSYALSPKVSAIVAMSTGLQLSKLITYDGKYSRVMPNFHPAYVLRGDKDVLQMFRTQIRLMSGKVK